MPKQFYAVLANTVIASITNTFVWFAVTFWIYLETQSVIATSIMAGIFTITIAFSGFWLGSIVDRYKKKVSMLISGVASLVLYSVAGVIIIANPPEAFTTIASVPLWIFVILILAGAIVGNLRGIALSTLVTIMIPEAQRDRANGMVGTANGVAFLVASIFSGMAIGYIGVFWTMVITIAITVVVLLHLWNIAIPENEIPPSADANVNSIDIRGSIQAIRAVPGLLALILFHTFNNFLGGVFMSLMDAYGLEMVSVQVWGTLWGILSLGFIIGGLGVARFGLGKNPIRTLFIANIAMWTITVLFPLVDSIIPLAIGMFIYLCLIPLVEASEQTILQKVIPPERQGRVFGFAQSVEQAASPITAFLIGPIAEWVFIPFMTTGAGVALIGDWFGVGKDRGLGLLFIVAALIGLAVTLLGMRSRAYRQMSEQYQRESELPLAPVQASDLRAEVSAT